MTWQVGGTVLLRGPAVIVGDIELDDGWLPAGAPPPDPFRNSVV